MDNQGRTLRDLVEKWLRPGPAMPARVVRTIRGGRTTARYTCVEIRCGRLSVLFFRHKGGIWNVCPPRTERPSMAPEQCAE